MRKLLSAAFPLLILCACPSLAGYPVRVTDARGKSVNIPAKPVRMVALAPSITEVLYALGLEERIAGVNSRSDYPAAAKKKPKVGDMTISAEAVIALKPDLVLGLGYLNCDAIIRLEKLELTVFAVDPKSIGQVIADIRTIGKLTARPATAGKLAKRMESGIAGVRASRAGKSPKNVLVVIQSSPLWVAGPKTFVDEMLRIANARNVARDARPGFVPFSTELAISRNPDVMVVGVKSDVDYFLESPEWRNTNAVRSKRVYVINNDLLVRPGPRLVAGLRELASALNR